MNEFDLFGNFDDEVKRRKRRRRKRKRRGRVEGRGEAE
jgi:hypothetical protein